MANDTLLRSALPRRQFLRFAGVGAAGLAGAALIGCGSDDDDDGGDAPAASNGGGTDLEQDQVRVGYLPITDASPLLVAHGNGTYESYGLEAPKPTLFRSWSSLAEAFQARQVDVATS